MIWSLHVGTTTGKLNYFASQISITTLTDIEFTDTANAIVGITTTHYISTFFLRRTPSTAVYTGLIRIHDSIVARGNYKGVRSHS